MTPLHALLVFLIAGVLAVLTAKIGSKSFPEYAGLAAFAVFVAVLLIGFANQLGTL